MANFEQRDNTIIRTEVSALWTFGAYLLHLRELVFEKKSYQGIEAEVNLIRILGFLYDKKKEIVIVFGAETEACAERE